MLDEFTIGDVVFTVFSYVICSVDNTIDDFSTSADDYINRVLQILEVRDFSHSTNVLQTMYIRRLCTFTSLILRIR